VAIAAADGCAVRVRPAGAPAAAPGAAPGTVLVAVAESREELPRATRIVIEAAGAQGRIAQHPDRSRLATIAPQPVSREQALAVAAELAARALRSGIAGGAAALPARVAFADCGGAEAAGRPGEPGLGCAVAVGAAGPLRLDLVAQGPHAIVGGTTGSGKSELLVGWVLAMAHDHSPLEVTVLLVDFKGGSAFAGLAPLPHCVGVITDLDGAGAVRALDSLAAELRRRERHLAASRAKSIDDLPPGSSLPRLVIIVDEFAAMVAGYPELHALFADIAARGRSLGVHLVLCTQRPAGVIRDAVLANSALRLSLRVNNRPDSVAVIGTDAAAALALEPRGRAWVAVDGAEPVLAQFPLVTPVDIDAVRRRWAGSAGRPHRPWLDPLPALVPLERLDAPDGADAVAFGLLDDPAAQAQPTAVYRPAEHGNLLVVGGAGSGKTTLLSALASGSIPARRVPRDIEGAWDALTGVLAEVRAPAPRAANPREHDAGLHDAGLHDAGVHDDGVRGARARGRLLLVDDLDALLPRLSDEHEAELLTVVSAVLREGPARGLHCVVTAQRLTAGLQAVAALCGSRIHLRMPSRQEFVLAGGDGTRFTDRLPPGGGLWGALRLQVAVPGTNPDTTAHRSPTPASPTPASPTLDRPLAVVARDPAGFAARLRRAFPRLDAPGAVLELAAAPASGVSVAAGPRAVAVVGDLDTWQAQWGALAALRATHTVIVEGYGTGDYRAVTRERALPPPLAAEGSAFWMLRPGGHAERARLDDGGPGGPR
jgi:S-DNA-T family DNA segregation ATPase FtsK/SpoIIIE